MVIIEILDGYQKADVCMDALHDFQNFSGVEICSVCALLFVLACLLGDGWFNAGEKDKESILFAKMIPSMDCRISVQGLIEMQRCEILISCGRQWMIIDN